MSVHHQLILWNISIGNTFNKISIAQTSLNREENDLSRLLGEGDDSDNDIDQEDQQGNEWGGWESYDD